MDKFARSWALARESWGVLRRTPSLMAFPVISAVFVLIASAAFVLPYAFITGFKDVEHTRPEVYVPLIGAFYFVTSFIVIFFNSGLVACAHRSLMGEQVTMSDGIRAALQRLPAILSWTLVAATVGVILKLIGEYFGTIGRIVEGLLGIAWGIVTYFVLPIVVVENGSPIAAIKKSAEMFKQTWGERLIAGGGMALALVALIFVPVPWIILVAFTGIPAIILPVVGMSVLYWVLLGIVGAALQGVYQVALYVYASTGVAPEAFGQTNFAEAFRSKPGIKDRFAGWRRR